jgi:hypothetical protein
MEPGANTIIAAPTMPGRLADFTLLARDTLTPVLPGELSLATLLPDRGLAQIITPTMETNRLQARIQNP